MVGERLLGARKGSLQVDLQQRKSRCRFITVFTILNKGPCLASCPYLSYGTDLPWAHPARCLRPTRRPQVKIPKIYWLEP